MSDTTPAGPEEQLAKDVSYSPASDREVAERQKSPQHSAATEDVPDGAVETLPGTGGPDDNGSVEVAAGEVHIPRDTSAH